MFVRCPQNVLYSDARIGTLACLWWEYRPRQVAEVLGQLVVYRVIHGPPTKLVFPGPVYVGEAIMHNYYDTNYKVGTTEWS